MLNLDDIKRVLDNTREKKALLNDPAYIATRESNRQNSVKKVTQDLAKQQEDMAKRNQPVVKQTKIEPTSEMKENRKLYEQSYNNGNTMTDEEIYAKQHELSELANAEANRKENSRDSSSLKAKNEIDVRFNASSPESRAYEISRLMEAYGLDEATATDYYDNPDKYEKQWEIGPKASDPLTTKKIVKKDSQPKEQVYSDEVKEMAKMFHITPEEYLDVKENPKNWKTVNEPVLDKKGKPTGEIITKLVRKTKMQPKVVDGAKTTTIVSAGRQNPESEPESEPETELFAVKDEAKKLGLTPEQYLDYKKHPQNWKTVTEVTGQKVIPAAEEMSIAEDNSPQAQVLMQTIKPELEVTHIADATPYDVKGPDDKPNITLEEAQAEENAKTPEEKDREQEAEHKKRNPSDITLAEAYKIMLDENPDPLDLVKAREFFQHGAYYSPAMAEKVLNSPNADPVTKQFAKDILDRVEHSENSASAKHRKLMQAYAQSKDDRKSAVKSAQDLRDQAANNARDMRIGRKGGLDLGTSTGMEGWFKDNTPVHRSIDINGNELPVNTSGIRINYKLTPEQQKELVSRDQLAANGFTDKQIEEILKKQTADLFEGSIVPRVIAKRKAAVDPSTGKALRDPNTGAIIWKTSYEFEDPINGNRPAEEKDYDEYSNAFPVRVHNNGFGFANKNIKQALWELGMNQLFNEAINDENSPNYIESPSEESGITRDQLLNALKEIDDAKSKAYNKGYNYYFSSAFDPDNAMYVPDASIAGHVEDILADMPDDPDEIDAYISQLPRGEQLVLATLAEGKQRAAKWLADKTGSIVSKGIRHSAAELTPAVNKEFLDSFKKFGSGNTIKVQARPDGAITVTGGKGQNIIFTKQQGLAQDPNNPNNLVETEGYVGHIYTPNKNGTGEIGNIVFNKIDRGSGYPFVLQYDSIDDAVKGITNTFAATDDNTGIALNMRGTRNDQGAYRRAMSDRGLGAGVGNKGPLLFREDPTGKRIADMIEYYEDITPLEIPDKKGNVQQFSPRQYLTGYDLYTLMKDGKLDPDMLTSNMKRLAGIIGLLEDLPEKSDMAKIYKKWQSTINTRTNTLRKHLRDLNWGIDPVTGTIFNAAKAKDNFLEDAAENGNIVRQLVTDSSGHTTSELVFYDETSKRLKAAQEINIRSQNELLNNVINDVGRAYAEKELALEKSGKAIGDDIAKYKNKADAVSPSIVYDELLGSYLVHVPKLKNAEFIVPEAMVVNTATEIENGSVSDAIQAILMDRDSYGNDGVKLSKLSTGNKPSLTLDEYRKKIQEHGGKDIGTAGRGINARVALLGNYGDFDYTPDTLQAIEDSLKPHVQKKLNHKEERTQTQRIVNILNNLVPGGNK